MDRFCAGHQQMAGVPTTGKKDSPAIERLTLEASNVYSGSEIRCFELLQQHLSASWGF